MAGRLEEEAGREWDWRRCDAVKSEAGGKIARRGCSGIMIEGWRGVVRKEEGWT